MSCCGIMTNILLGDLNWNSIGWRSDRIQVLNNRIFTDMVRWSSKLWNSHWEYSKVHIYLLRL